MPNDHRRSIHWLPVKAARAAKSLPRLPAHAILLVSGLLVPPAEGASACAQPIAELVSMEGVVEVRGASSPVASAAELQARERRR